jgi:predicted GNAT family acetyltransferase
MWANLQKTGKTPKRKDDPFNWTPVTKADDITVEEDKESILQAADLLQQAINRQRAEKEQEKESMSLAAFETAKAKTEETPEEVTTEAPKYGSIWERLGDTFEANSPQDQYKRQRSRDLAAKLVATGKIKAPEGVDIPKYSEERQKEAQAQAEARTEELKSGKAVNPQGLVAGIITYADAFGTDPVTAFEQMFKGNKIKRTNNGAIIIERMDLSESQKVKRDRDGDTTELKLDHIVPLQLGGSNDLDNLRLVPTEKWKKFTPMENAVATALRKEKIDKEIAEKLIVGFKNDIFTEEDLKLHVSGQGDAFENYRKRLQAFKSMQVGKMRELFQAGKLSEEAFKAGVISVNSIGDKTNDEIMREPGQARSLVGQVIEPAGGAILSTLGRIPADISSVVGTGLEALTPFDEQGQALQGFGETSGEAFNLFDSLTQQAREGENRAVTNISAGAGSLAASVALGPGKAGAVFGTRAAGGQTREAKKEGKAPWRSLITGAGAGVAEATLEKIGMDKYLGIKGGKAKQVLKGFVTEGTQEVAQSLAQSGVEQTYRDVNWSDAIGEALLEGGIGGIVGGGGRFAFSVANNLKSKGVDEDVAIRTGLDVQDKLETSIDKIKIKTETPTSEQRSENKSSVKEDSPIDYSKPIRAYHGTNQDFEDFEIGKEGQDVKAKTSEAGFWFTASEDEAKVYADYSAKRSVPNQVEHEKKVKELQGRIEEANNNRDFNTAEQLTEELEDLEANAIQAEPSGQRVVKADLNMKNPLIVDASTDDFDMQKSIAQAKKESKDGVVFEKISDAPNYEAGIGPTTQYLVFDKKQITTGKQLEIAKKSESKEDIAQKKETSIATTIKNKYPSVQIEVSEKNGEINLSKIIVPKEQRGQGIGSKAMQDIVDYADKTNQKIVLTPTNDYGGSKTRLKEFYKRFGFVENKGRNKDFSTRESMIRPASKKQVTKTRSATRTNALEAVADYNKPKRRGIDASPENLKRLADSLNKAAQSGSILRRGQYQSKKNLGVFQRPTKGGKGERIVKLQDAVIKDPAMYPVVLAHELSHAIEYNITGSTNKTYEVFGKLSKEDQATIESELKEVVNEIEGKEVAENKPEYFYKPTEMLARYVEMMVMEPGKVNVVAPKTTEKFEELVVREPMVSELVDAIGDKLDQGFKDKTPDIFKDLRQVYRKHLGKLAGDKAYGAEIARRADLGRAHKMLENLLKTKFKNVKDDPTTLFRAAEGIKITTNGNPEFGTYKYKYLAIKDQETIKKLKDEGWEDVGVSSETKDGKSEDEIILRTPRFTAKQAKEYFDSLSPEGQQLIKDFTAAKQEAKDDFNRELLKAVYKIDTNLEGWVHHYFEGKPMGGNPNVSLKKKLAAAKKQRGEAEGYIEDFRKATLKAMTELETKEINNQFIRDQLARISKPIAQGDKPDNGWVEVVADEKGGLRLPGEGAQVLIQQESGKSVKVPQKRYQVPIVLANHYREIRDIPGEINKIAKTMNRIGKYWGINVLTHPGTTSTNFLSGGAQYGLKILDDFYTDLLTADFGFTQTRKDLVAPIKALTPKGWNNAPDWMFGGYRSTLAGQYATMNSTDTNLDTSIERYGNQALKIFALVETYWKKTIALSEDSKLSDTQKRSMFKRLTADEKRLITELNKPIDLYGLDYDNTPLWLRNFDRKGGKLLKPFMKYPFKYTKLITDHLTAPFDKSLPWQTRTAKIMAIGTLVAMINHWYDDQEEKQDTPLGTEETPYPLRPGGRVFIGRAIPSGEELFVRTAKYPFFNLTSLGRSIVQRDFDESTDLLREQFGTIGPGLDLAMIAIGHKNEFDQYTPTSALLGQQTATLIPGFRILNDIGRMMDPHKRTPKNFIQGVAVALPIWGSEETRAKLRGKKKTIKIPDEPPGGRSITKTARTSTERDRLENKGDVLLSMLTGIYLSRIDPKEAKQQELREVRDSAETVIRDLLKAGNEADAQAMASEYGFTLPEGTLNYYRRGDDEKSSMRNSDIKKQLASLNLADYAESIGTTPSQSATPRLARLKTLAVAQRKYGWDNQQLASLDRLIHNESGWRATAKNPTSSAWGLFQFLDMHKRPGGYLPKGNDSNLEDQIAGGLKYIKERYGTPSNAFAAWLSRSPNWY